MTLAKEIQIREVKIEDAQGMLDLYIQVAENPKGIARSSAEITPSYIESIINGVANGGLGLVAYYENKLIGEIHASQKGIHIFDHLLSFLTIGVRPSYQGKGIGKLLFSSFLNHVKDNMKSIYRVELESRASNKAGIRLYESLGFIKEGTMINQTRNADGSHENGVMYAWFNPNYEKPLIP